MSLKAKIEAVIYASEEPVTLAQLMGLLGQEAQAELDHLEAAQQSLALEAASAETPSPDISTPDQDALNGEVLESDPESGSGPEGPAEPEDETEALAGIEAERTEELEQHLHQAAAHEAEHLRSARVHAAADEAAMSTADDLEAGEFATPAAPAASEEDVPAETPAAPEVIDEKKLAREAKEKERRLREYFRGILDQLIADYATSERGLEIREVANGFRLSTKPEYHDAVRGFVRSLKPPLKLSLQALETLAVVAYKQPVTAPEVSEIRGVDSGGVLGSLMTRKLVTTAGRKQVIGRPILYKTTKDFLLRFGLKDINELPSIEEFEKMAGELADAEPIQEEIPMEHHAPETPGEVEQERDETEPQADGDSTPEPVGEEIVVDGRISGPPPNYNTNQATEAEDSPALDAEVQSEQRHSEEGE